MPPLPPDFWHGQDAGLSESYQSARSRWFFASGGGREAARITLRRVGKPGLHRANEAGGYLPTSAARETAPLAPPGRDHVDVDTDLDTHSHQRSARG